MIRTLLSLGSIVFAVALVATGTVAFFGDTESSNDNVFTAGAIDLGIDNESYYNGAPNDGTSWELAYDLGNCTSLDNESPCLFFNFNDLKPDDEGEDTISVHVDTNDAWACMDMTVSDFDDNECTEPEGDDGDATCGDDEGELQNELRFLWWADDGDNVLEDNESESTFFGPASLATLELHVPLADASGEGILSEGPLQGGEDYYIGKAWCFGTLEIDPVPDGQGEDPTVDSGVTCNGTNLDNTTQTDSVMGEITFSAVQSRHNDEFLCNEGDPLGCLDEADVMLVLDRSGSIGGDMPALKTAAKAFVDALAPSTDGVHVGVASFAGTASLDHHLSDDGTSVKAAIDTLLSSGQTNLGAGISTADAELANPGDTHDRPDASSPDVMVIITDGESNVGGDGSAQATTAKGNGVEIYAVGIGITPGLADFLRDSIVSPIGADHYFDSADFGDLEAILGDLAMCEEEPV